jgi:hypothetical protein
MSIYVISTLFSATIVVSSLANSLALNMFWTLGNLNENLKSLPLLYTPYFVMSLGCK